MAKANAKRKPGEEKPETYDPEGDTAEAWEQWLGFAQDVLDQTQLHEPSKPSADDDED